jgi:hypothetical protein
LGFSRDGYHWHRPLPRQAFLKQSWPVHTWNNNDVQSAGGGLLLEGSQLLFYASGRKGLPLDEHWSGGNMSTGLATIRRDGFVSIESMLTGVPGTLVTRPMIFSPTQIHLFVNTIVQPGGFLQVGVLGHPELTLEASSLGGRAPNTCAPTDQDEVDSTRLSISWPRSTSSDLAAVAGMPVQLVFRLNGASLYSFWVSSSVECGHSGGFVGAGGHPRHGVRQGVDVAGSCGTTTPGL